MKLLPFLSSHSSMSTDTSHLLTAERAYTRRLTETPQEIPISVFLALLYKLHALFLSLLDTYKKKILRKKAVCNCYSY